MPRISVGFDLFCRVCFERLEAEKVSSTGFKVEPCSKCESLRDAKDISRMLSEVPEVTNALNRIAEDDEIEEIELGLDREGENL